MTDGERLSKPAARPDAPLACEREIAVQIIQEGVRDRLAREMVGAPRDLPDGVELRFRSDAWDAVRRYIEVESQCCPFLDLAARRTDDEVLLTVTGRPDAREMITQIFAPGTAA